MLVAVRTRSMFPYERVRRDFSKGVLVAEVIGVPVRRTLWRGALLSGTGKGRATALSCSVACAGGVSLRCASLVWVGLLAVRVRLAARHVVFVACSP